MRIGMLGAFLVVMAAPIGATTYKCDMAGHVVYSDKPCEKGENRPIALKVESPNGQTQAAMSSEERVEFEKQQAEALEKERLKKEKAEERANCQKSAKGEKKEKKQKKKSSPKPRKIRAKPVPKRSLKASAVGASKQ